MVSSYSRLFSTCQISREAFSRFCMFWLFSEERWWDSVKFPPTCDRCKTHTTFITNHKIKSDKNEVFKFFFCLVAILRSDLKVFVYCNNWTARILLLLQIPYSNYRMAQYEWSSLLDRLYCSVINVSRNLDPLLLHLTLQTRIKIVTHI